MESAPGPARRQVCPRAVPTRTRSVGRRHLALLGYPPAGMQRAQVTHIDRMAEESEEEVCTQPPRVALPGTVGTVSPSPGDEV